MTENPINPMTDYQSTREYVKIWYDNHILDRLIALEKAVGLFPPKPPSLKEQALQELDKVDQLWATEEFGQETLNSLDTIRRALESIPDPS